MNINSEDLTQTIKQANDYLKETSYDNIDTSTIEIDILTLLQPEAIAQYDNNVSLTGNQKGAYDRLQEYISQCEAELDSLNDLTKQVARLSKIDSIIKELEKNHFINSWHLFPSSTKKKNARLELLTDINKYKKENDFGSMKNAIMSYEQHGYLKSNRSTGFNSQVRELQTLIDEMLQPKNASSQVKKGLSNEHNNEDDYNNRSPKFESSL